LASFLHLLLGQSLSAHMNVVHAILVIVDVRPGKIEANTISLVNAAALAFGHCRELSERRNGSARL
jgi:hypothetical protein